MMSLIIPPILSPFSHGNHFCISTYFMVEAGYSCFDIYLLFHFIVLLIYLLTSVFCPLYLPPIGRLDGKKSTEGIS